MTKILTNSGKKRKTCNEDEADFMPVYAKGVVKNRQCLMCGKMFKSKGAFNRRCSKCSRLLSIHNKDCFTLTNCKVSVPGLSEYVVTADVGNTGGFYD